MNQKPIEQYTGEELCEIQAQAFNQLQQAQNNLQVINAELQRLPRNYNI